MLCDTIPEKDTETPKKFKLKADKNAVTIAIDS